nr:MAG TPA: hypothetical protein [Caudoviricetes sp.]
MAVYIISTAIFGRVRSFSVRFLSFSVRFRLFSVRFPRSI